MVSHRERGNAGFLLRCCMWFAVTRSGPAALCCACATFVACVVSRFIVKALAYSDALVLSSSRLHRGQDVGHHQLSAVAC